ncbi:MAG: glycosyl transferase family 2 [Betaproteobacteria bacterium RBG_16_56_24]|nr:MAG: glycosyl transferase family 2 [Betaproteobacteria bacterium RBG_16_56_24]
MSFDYLRILTIVHFASLGGLLCYGVHRLWLIACWYMEHRKECHAIPPANPEVFPMVTVQLPFYNERFVAARLIEFAARLDWPKDRLEIQVLDDSTDDTVGIVDETANRLVLEGVNIRIFRRGHRQGYKAGALQEGMAHAAGEFIAIFDADFLPQPDFLVRTVACFADPKVGMVQARWTFLNAGASWLTGVQSLLLGPHFGIEHRVRCGRNLFFNFNGTAGIWRRSAIESAGGWKADTVTEDLDLSYRAQLRGWKFVYRDDIAVPSELPITLAAFRSQQQRWAKGSIQTARKILPRLLASPLPFSVKAEAAAHLLANLGWLLGTLTTLTLYAAITWRVGIGPDQSLKADLPLLAGTSFAILMYFFAYALVCGQNRLLRWLPLLPVFGIGMAPSIALSVIKGALSSGGYFERTPKFGLQGNQPPPLAAFLYRQKAIPYLAMNTLFLCYSLLPVIFLWQRGTWLAIPFLLIFPAGFMLVILKDLADMAQIRRNVSAGS